MSSLSSILISTLKNFSFLSFNFTVKRGFCCPSSHWFYLQYQLFYWSWKCVYLQMLFSSSFLWILKYVILPQIYFSSPQYILFLFQRSHFFPCWKSHTFFFSSWLVSKLISDGCVSLGFEKGCSLYLTLKWIFTVPEGIPCDHSFPREGNVLALSVVPTENVCGCFICLFSEMFSYGHMSLSACTGLGYEDQASTSPEAHSNSHRHSLY